MKFKKYSAEEKSSFPYWFEHWKAYQYTAIKLGCWRFRFLLHDWEKPWMRLFMPYSDVARWHKSNRRHHSEYKGGQNKIDYLGLVIDYECSMLTKQQCNWNAYEYIVKKYPEDSPFRSRMHRILNKLNINKPL